MTRIQRPSDLRDAIREAVGETPIDNVLWVALIDAKTRNLNVIVNVTGEDDEWRDQIKRLFLRAKTEGAILALAHMHEGAEEPRPLDSCLQMAESFCQLGIVAGVEVVDSLVLSEDWDYFSLNSSGLMGAARMAAHLRRVFEGDEALPIVFDESDGWTQAEATEPDGQPQVRDPLAALPPTLAEAVRKARARLQ